MSLSVQFIWFAKKMNKKAQVVLISLWILVIITVLAVGTGHRVSMGLRLARYQRDRLRAFYLAKAGISRAIAELEKDTNDYDALSEAWADNAKVFKSISFDVNKNEFSAVSYVITGEDGKPNAVYGARDEESKVNINTAPTEILTALLEYCGVEDSSVTANNLRIWRGDSPDTDKIYEGLGYPCKAAKFSSIAELVLVKGITPEDFRKLEGLITVYGDGLININTASEEVFSVAALGIARKLGVADNFAESLVSKIAESKEQKGYFKTKEDLDIELTGEEEINIFNGLLGSLGFSSNNFLIEAAGNTSKIKSRIKAVYNRKDKKIIYWHEG